MKPLICESLSTPEMDTDLVWGDLFLERVSWYFGCKSCEVFDRFYIGKDFCGLTFYLGSTLQSIESFTILNIEFY